METKANYVLIGAFTILVGLGLLFFGLWAAKYSSERNWQEYKIIFHEAVTGLTTGSQVQYNGIVVGSITNLSLAADDPTQVNVRIRLNTDTVIKTDTSAQISITSVTGSSIIQLSGGSPQAPRLLATTQDSIPEIRTNPSALQNISDTANRLVERLDRLLSDENIAAISITLTNLKQTTSDLSDREKGLLALLTSARDTTQNLNRTITTANNTLSHLDQGIAQQLPGTLKKLDSAAGYFEAILGENRQAINSFANDGLGQLGPTLRELRGLTSDLRQLSDRLADNPARYLLGQDAPKEFEPK